MSEELAVLYRVQQLDTEIARRQQALSALDSGAQIEEEIQAIRADLAELADSRQAADNESLNLELELKALQQKREAFNAQLYGGRVSNPRQLSDLQQEVEMLSREIRRIEDRLLELMESVESNRARVELREARLGELERQLESVRATYAEVGSRLRAEIAQLQNSREEKARQVSAALLRRYEQIRGRAANLGVVRVMGSECPGCHITLPSETLKQVKAGRSVLACDNCARLLYWETVDQGEDA